MTTFKPDELIKCPHCGEEQEDTAAEHLIPNKPLKSLNYECVHCNEMFSVVGTDNNDIKVEAV
jgi:DNA-directed RNA polymerase subunit RPC12/RpoP